MSNALDASIARHALAALSVGVLILNEDRIEWANDTLLDWFGIVFPDLLDLNAQQTQGTRFDGLFDDVDRLNVTGADGRMLCLQRRRINLGDGSHTLHCFQDITEWADLEAECQKLRANLSSLETKDSVTGLMNTKAILDALESQASRSRRYENPLSLLRLSLESSAGADELAETLHNIGLALKDQLRWADQLGMLDATTFLIILPETTMTDAKELAFHLANNRIPLPENSSDLSISFGAASWQKGDDPRKLLRRLKDDQQLASIALLS